MYVPFISSRRKKEEGGEATEERPQPVSPTPSTPSTPSTPMLITTSTSASDASTLEVLNKILYEIKDLKAWVKENVPRNGVAKHEPETATEAASRQTKRTRRKTQEEPAKRYVPLGLIYYSSMTDQEHAQVLKEFLRSKLPDVDFEVCDVHSSQREADVAILIKQASSQRLDITENDTLRDLAARTPTGDVILVKALQSNDIKSAPYNPPEARLQEVHSGIGLKRPETAKKALVFITFNFPLSGESAHRIQECHQNNDNLANLVTLLQRAINSRR